VNLYKNLNCIKFF